MRTLRFLCLFVLLVLSCAAAAQQNAASITVVSFDGTQTKFTVDQLLKMPQQAVSVTNPHTKATEKYEGVLLSALLGQAGAPFGEKLRGAELRDYVEITSKDGYKVVYALAELDPSFQDNKVVVAITSDGKPLDASHGPVQVVAPQDKKLARSPRMVEVIALRRAQ